MDVPLWEVILRIMLALVFGALIGLDRELKQKPAGLRTMMLVALGAASITLLAGEAIDALAPASAEPGEIIGGVVTGIGFLGAGTIIQARGSVQGITTAAGIWVTAALGIGFGLGAYRVATTTGILAVAIISAARFIERRMRRRRDPARAENAHGG